MKQSARMRKHEGKLGSYKIALLLCLISLAGLLLFQTLGFIAAKKQNSNAQMASEVSPKHTAVVASTVLMTPSILDFSATQQATLISQGKLSSTELVSAYLTRIEAMDRKGPSLQSILSLNPMFRLQWEKAQNCFVLLFPEGMVKLNAGAGEIIQLIDGKTNAEHITEALQSKFPDANNLTADVDEFITIAIEKKWLYYD